MKALPTLFALILSTSTVLAQCEGVDVGVTNSDTAYVQLYHPGFFLLPSGFANVCVWEVTTSSGDVVFEATTSGSAFEQGTVNIAHNVPITDSMFVSLVITNAIEGTTCTIQNIVVWTETEVLPGIFVGNWAVPGFNPGVATAVNELGTDNAGDLVLFPSPAEDQVRIDAPLGSYALTITSTAGAVVHSDANFTTDQPLDVSHLQPGTYIVGLQDERGVTLGMRRFIKM